MMVLVVYNGEQDALVERRVSKVLSVFFESQMRSRTFGKQHRASPCLTRPLSHQKYIKMFHLKLERRMELAKKCRKLWSTMQASKAEACPPEENSMLWSVTSIRTGFANSHRGYPVTSRDSHPVSCNFFPANKIHSKIYLPRDSPSSQRKFN